MLHWGLYLFLIGDGNMEMMQENPDMFQNICINAPEIRRISEVNKPRFRFVLDGVGYVPFLATCA